ncbi:MAG: NusA-like transcription termination signal-binding factor [Candidatus Thermoplasmatota archaeon]
MTDISLSNKNVQYINMASRVTQADILDCLINDDQLVFIVKKGQMGAAIGRKAKHLEKLRSMFKKSIKFVELVDDKKQFVINLFKPYNIEKVELKGDEKKPVARVKVKPGDKAKAIGKNGSNIETIRKLASRHHNIKDVQIK